MFAPAGGQGFRRGRFSGYAGGGFRPGAGRESPPRSGARAPVFAGNGRSQAGSAAAAWGQLRPGGAYQVASPQLATSPIMRGQRSAWSRREALILVTLINHPWLLHDHLEEVAALELGHPEAHRLRAAVIAAFASDHHHSADREEMSAQLRADLAKSGFSELLQRVEKGITTPAVWGARPGAAAEDVIATWHQLVSLHHQWHSLLRELKDAETALGEDATDSNYAWLQDVKGRLTAADGIEALIEGFGESSGRSHKSM
jgi:DNA primase